MTFAAEVFGAQRYATEAAARIALSLPGEGAVVLTGGRTARSIYPALAETHSGWGELHVFFSDERCVPPGDEASNFAMVARLLLEPVGASHVHRMAGEMVPEEAAVRYDAEIAPAVSSGIGLTVLGMGADCHVAALFPGSPAVREQERLCVAVDRPDGRKGVTLTPPALLSSRTVLVVVAGEAKADAVRRAVERREGPETCPVGLFRDHPDATFLLDEAAASRL